MERPPGRPSPRRAELLERAYAYALEHGVADLSLRPLAVAVGSSPRVLLFLFDSKEGLVRALLERARADELALLERARSAGPPDLHGTVRTLWTWLAAPAHRPLLALWTQAYAQSLVDPAGPWAGFARATVDDWLAVLTAAGPPPAGDHAGAHAEAPTLALAVLRGALLDLLATGDAARTTRAVEAWLKAPSNEW